MKKIIGLLILTALMISTLAACAQGTAKEPGDNSNQFDNSKDIVVVSREDGSGTRGAFIELFGIEEKGADGTKKDLTTKEAIIAKQTDVMMTNIAGDNFAIGYISLGSLNDTVKAVQIENVEATPDNVKNGSYPIARPFNIATNGEPSDLAKDFIDFILSSDGQSVVESSYIPVVENASAYAGSKSSGKIVVAGSSSVTPIMEKLKEAYLAINTGATIEIQMSDSSAGITGAIEGTCDIGMASRDLKDSELEQLTSTQIALDGIAVIINTDNPTSNLSIDQVKSVFTGETLAWSEIG